MHMAVADRHARADERLRQSEPPEDLQGGRRDADGLRLGGRLGTLVDEQDAQSPLSQQARQQQANRAGADDGDVVIRGGSGGGHGAALAWKPIRHARLIARIRGPIPAQVALFLERRRQHAVRGPQHGQGQVIRRPHRRRPEDEREGEVDRLAAVAEQAGAGERAIKRPLVAPHRPPAKRADLDVESGVVHRLGQQDPGEAVKPAEQPLQRARRLPPEHLRRRPEQEGEQQLRRGEAGEDRGGERGSQVQRHQPRHEPAAAVREQERVPERELRHQRQIQERRAAAMPVQQADMQPVVEAEEHHPDGGEEKAVAQQAADQGHPALGRRVVAGGRIHPARLAARLSAVLKTGQPRRSITAVSTVSPGPKARAQSEARSVSAASSIALSTNRMVALLMLP